MLSSITDFDWDTLIIIRSYSNPWDVLEECDVKYAKINSNVNIHDGVILFVFCENGKIVQYCNLSAWLFEDYFYNELNISVEKSKVDKEEAVFVINNNSCKDTKKCTKTQVVSKL